MKTVQTLSCLAAIAWLVSCAGAQAQSRAQYEAMVAAEAQANLVPEELVHRVIVRESKYQPHLIGRGVAQTFGGTGVADPTGGRELD
ncbi:MAG: lytic transglycosylase domain-containing protein, partial [Bradyrhizobium sp.]